jgi:ADP-glucose pyrophosphorylase
MGHTADMLLIFYYAYCSCIIQNSILCKDVVIENNCNLKDCVVGAKVRVNQGSKLKSEAMALDM